MPRQRKGYVYFDKKLKSWFARLPYTDELGTKHNIRKLSVRRCPLSYQRAESLRSKCLALGLALLLAVRKTWAFLCLWRTP
jgi:hypothetical protein